MDIIAELLQGNRRALARAVTLVENDDPRKKDIIKNLYPRTGQAYIIGFTGPPGSGKSTLIDRLIFLLRKEGLKVGVVSVDPMSPFTGGAILGDRVRMGSHTGDKDVFIRSMSSRGKLGGLSHSTKDVIFLMDAFGKDYILIETVGVGQSELDIAQSADTNVLVLTPASGDSIQTLKAGIMETPDIFLLNKCDLFDSGMIKMEIENMLSMNENREWRPPVIKAAALNEEGTDSLWNEIKRHRNFLEAEGHLEEIRKQRAGKEIEVFLEEKVKSKLWDKLKSSPYYNKIMEEVKQGELDPLSAALEIVERVDFRF